MTKFIKFLYALEGKNGKDSVHIIIYWSENSIT